MTKSAYLNRGFWLSMIALFVWGLLINLQTMFVDEGFYLTGYQNFFKDITITGAGYLTSLVGGLWDVLFGFGGILSHRIFGLLLGAISFYFTWRLLKEFSGYSFWIFLGCFLPTLHGIAGCMGSISGFILAIASCYLYESYKEDSIKKYIIASVLVGMCLFGRFTAILMIAILFLPPLFHINDTKSAIKQAFVGLGGFVFGMVLVVLLITCMGHLDAYYQSIFVDLVSSGKSEGSTHNIWNLVYVYFRDCGIVFGSLLVILMLSSIIKEFGILKNKTSYTALLVISFSGLFVLMKILVDKVSPISHNYVLCVASFALLVLSGWETIKKYDFLVTLIVVKALIGPIGSDVAILGHGCCFLALALPMFMSSIDENPHCKRIIGLVLTICLAYTVFRVRWIVMFSNFWDNGPRYEMTYKLEGSDLATVFVSGKTKQTMDPLLFELKKYVKPDDELMCFISIPIIHYLTETSPYAYHSCPAFCDPDLFREKMKKAESEKSVLPVVVMERKAEKLEGANHIKYECLKAFMQRHGYHEVWNNDEYILSIPKSRDGK